MTTAPQVLIIGFGAVGSVYGYILSKAGCEVTAIARSAYSIFQDQGIDFRSEKFGNSNFRPYRFVKDASTANDRIYQYIIVCVKALPDVQPTSTVLSEFLEGNFKGQDGQGPTVVLIQNGIGIETDLQKTYPLVPIISVVAWIGVNLVPATNIVIHGKLEKLIIGLFIGEGIGKQLIDPAGYSKDSMGEERLRIGWKKTNEFGDFLKKGGGGVEVVEDIQVHRYSKNLWNASLSTLCTLARAPVSSVISLAVIKESLPIVRRTMLEVLYVARAMGYSEALLPATSVDDSIKITLDNYQMVPPNTILNSFKPSMLLDLEASRPLELEVIIGSLVERARLQKVETPRLDYIYATLKIYQLEAVGKLGIISGGKNGKVGLTTGTPIV